MLLVTLSSGYRVYFRLQFPGSVYTGSVNTNTCSQEIKLTDNELFKYTHVTRP